MSEEILATSLPFQSKEKIARVYQVAVIVIVVIASVYIFLIRDQLVKWSTYGYIGIFAINMIGSASVLVPVPSPLASIVGASIYNPMWVGIVSGLGAAIGEMSSYFTGRVGTFIVEDSRLYKWMEMAMLRFQWPVIFLLAFIPNPFFDLTGMLAGLLRIPIKYYFPVMLIGKLCKFILLAYIAAGTLSFLPF